MFPKMCDRFITLVRATAVLSGLTSTSLRSSESSNTGRQAAPAAAADG